MAWTSLGTSDWTYLLSCIVKCWPCLEQTALFSHTDSAAEGRFLQNSSHCRSEARATASWGNIRLYSQSGVEQQRRVWLLNLRCPESDQWRGSSLSLSPLRRQVERGQVWEASSVGVSSGQMQMLLLRVYQQLRDSPLLMLWHPLSRPSTPRCLLQPEDEDDDEAA